MTGDDVQHILDSLAATQAALEGSAIIRPNKDGTRIEAVHTTGNGEPRRYGFPSEEDIVLAYRSAERLRKGSGASRGLGTERAPFSSD